MSYITYNLQLLLGRLNEEGGRRIKCIRFTDDMALLADDERMLKNTLMELNDRCDDYRMKININNTKIMVIRRKPKKIDIQIKDESFEQVDSFKYLGAISVAT